MTDMDRLEEVVDPIRHSVLQIAGKAVEVGKAEHIDAAIGAVYAVHDLAMLAGHDERGAIKFLRTAAGVMERQLNENALGAQRAPLRLEEVQMGDVVHVDFGGRCAPRSGGERVVSMTWTLDREAVMVWVIDATDRSTDEDIGTFDEHAAAVRAATAVARQRDLLVVDHTAIGARGVWNHRPVATGIHVYPSAVGYFVAVEPPCLSWFAHGGTFKDIDVAGDRAVELSEELELPIVDHVVAAPAC